jgi:hypothetical protein
MLNNIFPGCFESLSKVDGGRLGGLGKLCPEMLVDANKH